MAGHAGGGWTHGDVVDDALPRDPPCRRQLNCYASAVRSAWWWLCRFCTRQRKQVAPRADEVITLMEPRNFPRSASGMWIFANGR